MMPFRMLRPWAVVLVSLVSALTVSAAENVDPANTDAHYAFAANLGWLNAEPSGDGGPGAELTADAMYGWVWSANTGWVSLNCRNTSSCGEVDYGITHDGSGNLGGFAWSPNIGWISFSCANTASCDDVDYGVGVDVDSGTVSGFAWAANAGWISFTCRNTDSCGDNDYGVVFAALALDDVLFADGFEP
jgi:hypothetical protein